MVKSLVFFFLNFSDIKPSDITVKESQPLEAPSLSMVLAKLNEMPTLTKVDSNNDNSLELNQNMDDGDGEEEESSAITEDDPNSNSSSVHSSNVYHKWLVLIFGFNLTFKLMIPIM